MCEMTDLPMNHHLKHLKDSVNSHLQNMLDKIVKKEKC